MIIPYNKNQQRFQLIYSLLWLGLSVASFFYDPASRISYFNIVFGGILLSNYLLCRFNPYGVIGPDFIEKGIIWKTKIKIDDITKIKMFAGDIQIYSKSHTIVFDKNKMDKHIAPEVESYFRNWILEHNMK